MLRKEDSYGIFLEKPGSKRPLGRTRLRKENDMKQLCILNKKGGRLSTDSSGSASKPVTGFSFRKGRRVS